MIICVKCKFGTSDVIDSRPSLDSNVRAIRRRRKCRNCGHRFTTYEVSSEMRDAAIESEIKRVIEDAEARFSRALTDIRESMLKTLAFKS